jgi:hypothetical protein
MLGDAVHTNIAAGDHHLALTATIGNADQFEQIAQLDKFAAQMELGFGHMLKVVSQSKANQFPSENAYQT